MTAFLTSNTFSVNVDGHGTRIDLEIVVDNSGLFQAFLPHYVAAILKRESVQADTMRAVIEQYESACEEYQRIRLANQGRKVLLVNILAGHTSPTIPHVAMGIEQDTELDGRLLRHDFSAKTFNWIRLPHTEENLAKLTALQDTIKTAANIMNDFMLAADPEKFLHEIQFAQVAPVAEQAPEAEPMSLPLEASDDDEL